MNASSKAPTREEVEHLEALVTHAESLEAEAERNYKSAEAFAAKARRQARDARSDYESEQVRAELEAAYAAYPMARVENLPKSEWVEKQTRKFEVKYEEDGRTYRLTAKVRYDDQCGNGHNTFSITADLDSQARPGGWREESGGCLHELIAKHFGGLREYIKWHLVSSDGPMYYLENTTYRVKTAKETADKSFDSEEAKTAAVKKFLDHARSSAVWPEATDEELLAPGLRTRLLARLPQLMLDFQAAVKSLGFIY